MVGEIMRGNFTRLEGSAVTLSNRMGLLPKLFTDTGAVILATLAAVALFAKAEWDAEQRTIAFQKSIQATSGFAGKTASDLDEMAHSVAGSTQSVGEFSAALAQVNSTGQFTGSQLQMVTQAALDFGTAMGGSVDEAIKQFERLGNEPVQASADLNEQYHYLTLSIYEQIRALDAQGEHLAAVTLAQQSYAQYLAQSREAAEQNERGLSGMWDRFKSGASDAVQNMEDWSGYFYRAVSGTETLEEKYRDALQNASNLREQLRELTDDPHGYASDDYNRALALTKNALQAADDVVRQLRADMMMASAADGLAAAAQQQSQAIIAAYRAVDAAREKYIPELGREKQLNDLIGSFFLAHKGAPNDPTTGLAELQRVIDGMNGPDKAPKKMGLGIDRAQLADDVAAYQSAWQTAQKTFSNAERQLDAQRKADAIADKEYFAAKQADIDALLAAQLKALATERAGLLAHATTAAQRIRVDGQVRDIDAKVEQAKQDAAAKTDELQQRSAENDKQRAQQYSQLQQQYYQAIGDTGAAQLLRVQEQFDKAMQTMTAAANTDGQKIAK
ncbi:MAG: phage tail length tape measure family protein, partial [Proteobacteria bacterium]|nr:phage tail length tape measure family protein [Pseudomonadota bacterium]